MRHVQEIGNFPDQMIFVPAEMTIGKRNLPQALDEPDAFGEIEGAVDLGGELLIIGGVAAALLGGDRQFGSLLVVQQETFAHGRLDDLTFIILDFGIHAHHFGQQGGGRNLQAPFGMARIGMQARCICRKML